MDAVCGFNSRAADRPPQLPDGGLCACLAPNCFTFEQSPAVAGFVANPAAGSVPETPANPPLLDDVQRQPALFCPIAYRGLAELVADLFADLKRQEIWPDEFKRICKQPATRQRTGAGRFVRAFSSCSIAITFHEEGRLTARRLSDKITLINRSPRWLHRLHANAARDPGDSGGG
jgi:hypothetical protein